MAVDIACVGFGPAMGGFLTALSRALMNEDGTPALESKVMPGMPLQVLCYERADDAGFGVSGIVTSARSIRQSFPDLDPSQIPMAHDIKKEKVVYLLDPVGASRRSPLLRFKDKIIRMCRWLPWYRDEAFELPYTPPFLNKHGGLMLSMGQFNQWVASQIMAGGLIQIWPGMPVNGPLFEGQAVKGIRLADQGVDKNGNPDAGYMPGMDINAALTVVADGPVGAVGQKLNHHFGMPDGHHQRDWAVGMKMVVELPESCTLEPGTVIHTFGYPEPGIFGFFYVYPGRLASIGVFIPSWFESPVRTSYRYLQHWMMHPYLWKHLEGGTMRSWGAKSLQESGRRGEPQLVGDGFARIGEGSGSTNVLTNSGVDEAWATGTLLAEAVIELAKAGEPFSGENLEKTYVAKRRASWIESGGRVAEHARDGFQKGFVPGLLGTALAGLTRGKLAIKSEIKHPREHLATMESYFDGKISRVRLTHIRTEMAKNRGTAGARSLHDVLMEEAGWPPIPYDGKLLMSHQDALLVGGKVQAPSGFADHVSFLYPNLCETCETKVCIEMCSAQAIYAGEGEVPEFDREKCVHCGACLWNCAAAHPGDPERGNIEFRAGAGGLHSAEN